MRFVRTLICILIAIYMIGCATDQFKLGEEVSPPNGCIAAKVRGHDC